MTPDEHRAKAEELREQAERIEVPHRPTPATRDRLIAEATLHALLALGGVESKLRQIREVLDDHDYPAGALYDIRQILDARP